MPLDRPWFDEPTERERVVLELVAQGLTLNEIGRRMNLTRSGVQSRLRQLRHLWNVQSVNQLYMLAGIKGWVHITSSGQLPRVRYRGRNYMLVENGLYSAANAPSGSSRR